MNGQGVVLAVAKNVDVQWLIAELRSLKKKGVVCWFDKDSFKLTVYGQAEQNVRKALHTALEKRKESFTSEEAEKLLEFLTTELQPHRWGKTVGYLTRTLEGATSMAPLLEKLKRVHGTLDGFVKRYSSIFVYNAGKGVRLRDHLLPPVEWKKRDKEHAVKVVLGVFESVGVRRGGYMLISHAEAELAVANKNILKAIVLLYGSLVAFFMAFPVSFECDGLHVREVIVGPVTAEDGRIVREFFAAAMKDENVVSVKKTTKALAKVHPVVVKSVELQHGSMQKFLVTTFPNEFSAAGGGKIRFPVSLKRHEKKEVKVAKPHVESGWAYFCGACGQTLTEHSCDVVCLTITYRNDCDENALGLVYPERHVAAVKLDLLENLCKTVQLCREKEQRSARELLVTLKSVVSEQTLLHMNQHNMGLSDVIKFLDIRSNFGGVTEFVFKPFKKSVTPEWKDMVSYPVPYFPGTIYVAKTEGEGAWCMRLLLAEKGIEFYGVDCEWKPENGSTNKLDLIQISTEKTCALLRVGLWSEPCEELLDFFKKPFVKLMKSPDIADFKKLADFGVREMSGVVDLDDHPQLRGSLKKAVIRILQWNMDKSCTLSNWAAPSYTPRQIRYAATDAWINVMLWKKIRNEHPHS